MICLLCTCYPLPVLLCQCDFILLGLLVFEMATGKRPYTDIYSLDMVVIAMLNEKLQLSVEAEHFLQRQNVNIILYSF